MKVQFGDQLVDGDVILFAPQSEPWCEYHASDGAIIRFRSTISQLIKLRQKNPDGTAIYVCISQNQMSSKDAEPMGAAN